MENRIRYFIKDDGTKVLQQAVQIRENTWKYEDIPMEYESELARYNETAEVKINRRDIEVDSFVPASNSSGSNTRMRHIPSGTVVEDPYTTNKDREKLLAKLLSFIPKQTKPLSNNLVNSYKGLSVSDNSTPIFTLAQARMLYECNGPTDLDSFVKYLEKITIYERPGN